MWPLLRYVVKERSDLEVVLNILFVFPKEITCAEANSRVLRHLETSLEGLLTFRAFVNSVEPSEDCWSTRLVPVEETPQGSSPRNLPRLVSTAASVLTHPLWSRARVQIDRSILENRRMLGIVRQLQLYDDQTAGPFAVYLPVPLTVEEEDEIYRNLALVTGLVDSDEQCRMESLGVVTESSQEIPPNSAEDGDLAAAEQMRNEGEEYD